MTTATLPSGTGIVSTYSYDNADRLTGISHVKNGSTTVASVSYTLDDVGNRTQRVDQAGTHSYSYDDLYRLTSFTYPGPATTSYAFDAFGNRTSMTVGPATTSYSYDDADRLTAVTPPSPASAINYTWDPQRGLDGPRKRQFLLGLRGPDGFRPLVNSDDGDVRLLRRWGAQGVRARGIDTMSGSSTVRGRNALTSTKTAAAQADSGRTP